MDPELLAQAAGEIDLEYRKARNDVVFAGIPLVMGLVAMVGLRKKRAQLRAALAQLDRPAPIDADVIEPEEASEGSDGGLG